MDNLPLEPGKADFVPEKWQFPRENFHRRVTRVSTDLAGASRQVRIRRTQPSLRDCYDKGDSRENGHKGHKFRHGEDGGKIGHEECQSATGMAIQRFLRIH